MGEKILVKYHVGDLPPLSYIGGKSDWVDLRASRDYSLKKGDFCLIDLGVSVQLPKGYEMILAARSSLFKNYGLIQTNGIGIVDESYCSDEDVLMMPVYASRDCEVRKGERVCQFRILAHQPELTFEEREHLPGARRGGFGSSGRV